jgi:CheY-like chemotaxis protein
MMAASGAGDAHAREIAAGLVAAVRAAIAAAAVHDGKSGQGVAATARALAWSAAVNVADLLELPGLAALLGACSQAAAPSSAVERALDRLTRLAAEAEARGDMHAFTHADRELGELAASPELREVAPPAAGASDPTSGAFAALSAVVGPATRSGTPAPATSEPERDDTDETDVRSLDVLLADFEFDDPAAIANARVTLPVAAGLRAALDWIAADAGGRMHVQLQDAALTLVARAAHEPGLGAAGAVLGLTGGALLPEPDGRWALRVPLHSARPAFLLARQGELSLALPWHAVARLKITDAASRANMTEPSLEPWSPLARGAGERPAALLSLGLSRAWLHLDHIVWRVFARPERAVEASPVPGSTHGVRTEEGEVFRVVDLEQALRGVPPLHTPAPPLAGAPAPRVQPSLATTVEIPIEIAPELPPAPAAAQLPPVAARPAEPVVLGPEFVRALGAPGPAVHSSHPAVAAPPAAAPAAAAVLQPARAAESVAKPGIRRALVVDDSLVARMELGRVLERRGWEVEWVETAAEMWSTLPDNDWSIVFVDVSLPDARGRAHLKTLAAQQRVARHRFELVALTRDEADERLVLDVGILRMLRKPFTPGAVERMMRELRAAGV